MEKANFKKHFGDGRANGQRTERGDLLVYFRDEVNSARKANKFSALPISFYAMRLTGVPTKDLYALKSKMEDGMRRGVSASLVFFGETKPKTEAV